MTEFALRVFFHITPPENVRMAHSHLQQLLYSYPEFSDYNTSTELDQDQARIKVMVGFEANDGTEAELKAKQFVDLVVDMLSASERNPSVREGSNMLSYA